jgi:hypothetical protein
MLSLKRQSYQAFTISEVMLSGFLLTMGILSVVGLFVVAQRSARETRSITIATALAQEGIEIARNIRDNNIAYRVANWGTCSTSTAGACDPFNGFPNNGQRTVSYNSSAFTVPGNTFLSYNGSGFQHHGAGTFTGFFRIIKIDHTGPADTARVQSFVHWQSAAYPDYVNPTPHISGAAATTWCIPSNRCVYTELLLTGWR